MNSKKEIVIASLFALVLASGLGAVSYSLFANMPLPETSRPVLDVYTQKGGVGANISGGVFEPFDIVFLYAYLNRGDAVLKNIQVNFTLKNPENAETLRTALTNDSGIAAIGFTLLPSEGPVIGAWHILAEASVDDKVVTDILSFQCESQSAQINIHIKRTGLVSTVFLPKEEVSVDAQVSHTGVQIVGAQVIFKVRTPNDTVFLAQSSQTNTSGIATISFQIPWPSGNVLGIWHVSAESEVYQQPVNAIVSFECQLLSSVLDVYTHKNGRGQNMPGRTFALNETVTLYAEIRDQLNKTVPDKMIAFEVKQPDRTTILIQVKSTNSSGIATVVFRIPPVESFIGTWEVYARTEYNSTVLLDTLTFKCEQQT